MANLTITVDEELLRKARIRALQQGTSVNAVLREYLEAYSGRTSVRDSIARVLSLARAATSSSGPRGRRWTREELHER